jgi:hypothetical protein
MIVIVIVLVEEEEEEEEEGTNQYLHSCNDRFFDLLERQGTIRTGAKS